MPFLAKLILMSALVLSNAMLPQMAHAQPAPPEPGEPISRKEKAMNFATVFAAQAATYYITQRRIIEQHGSWQNWLENPLHPHFDKDNFDFNVVKHSFVGQYYYLFYRSRGYTERQAFFWSFGSSLLFEFGIETFTERPSFQDIYQTPVFGTILGFGTERLSNYFEEVGTIPASLLAYVLNPFKLLPDRYGNYRLHPVAIPRGGVGVAAAVDF